MALGDSHLVRDMQVIPVAGRDSMLLNLCGAHGPFFLRNLIILKDGAGRAGVGEVPGGDGIPRALERAIHLVVARPVAAYNEILNDIRKSLGAGGGHQVSSTAE